MTANIASALSFDHSAITFRSAFGLGMALVVTVALFWTMSYLIESTEQRLDEGATLGQVEFVRVKRIEDPPPRKIPDEVPRPEPPPAPPDRPEFDDQHMDVVGINIGDGPIAADIDLPDRFGAGLGEGDYLPVVKVEPIYPHRALSRGIEGYCIVEYTVTRQGTVRDVRVIADQCTSSLFHKTCIDAALKFKYKPRVIDGEPVEVTGVQNKFTFEITEP